MIIKSSEVGSKTQFGLNPAGLTETPDILREHQI